MASNTPYDLHIYLTSEQHRRLKSAARGLRQPMTTIARQAIIGYLNNYEETEQAKNDRSHEKRSVKDETRRVPSGLGVAFDPKPVPAPTPTSPVLPAIPLGVIGSLTPDLKPLVEHVKKAETSEEKDRRLASVTETIRVLCSEKEAEALIQKVKTETAPSGNGISNYFRSLLP